MGDPKFSKRKYDTPSHPWRAERIKNETELQKRFGLKNKREVWKAQSLIRSFRAQSRELQARIRTGEKQAEIEVQQLLRRCARLGLLPMEGATLNDVLALNVENVLSRRFQTMVFQKGMAYSFDQARQFITHGHVAIMGRIVTIPGYLVRRDEENDIGFSERSPLASDLHPMRPKPKEAIELEKQKALIELAAKEAEAEKRKEAPKKEPEIKHPKAVKPSLEKLIEKDGIAEETPVELPELDEEAETKPEAKPEEKKPEKKERRKKEK